MKVNAKVYYVISSGEVLIVTPEMEGFVEKTSKEQDIEIYEQLKGKNISEIDFIELEYGRLVEIFKNLKSYSVDLKSKKLKCVYYTNEELEELHNNYKNLNSRISDIQDYLVENSTSITDVENYILENEKNKILGEM